MKYSTKLPGQMDKHFEPLRFWKLLKLEAYRRRKAVGMIFIVAFGMMFTLDLLLSGALEQHKLVHDFNDSYAFVLLIGGFVLSSLAFNDLGSPIKQFRYLMLPVSVFERWVCQWLLTSFGWIILFTLLFTMYTWLATAIGQLVFRSMVFETFHPFGYNAFFIMINYFVLQGIFMVGATQFRGYVFPKVLLFMLVLSAIGGGLAYLIMQDVLHADHECNGFDCEVLNEMDAQGGWKIATWLYWYLLAPLLWVITYVGLKEQQV